MSAGRATVVLSCVFVLAGCATVPRDPAARAEFKANHDPIEPLNRRIFAFNGFVDRSLIKPVAKGYRWVLPEPARNALRHFLDNLHEPVVLANDLLQGRLRAAATTGGRFLLNSTAGIGGFADVASRHQLPKQSGDFGQTLWTWGVPEGPYLILPILGPSNPRDGIGGGADFFADPFRYITPPAVSVSRMATDGIDERVRNLEIVDEMQREAVDYYASLRSLFRQNRAAQLGKGAGAPAAPQPPPDFYDDPGRSPPSSAVVLPQSAPSAGVPP